ncbi:MAG: hypothetical protein ABH829_00785 [archaeon]
MELQAILGIVLLLVVIYTGTKILKDFVKGLILMALVLVASFMIVGGMPELKAVPLLGGMLSPAAEDVKLDSSVDSVILAVKDIAWSIDVAAVSKDSEGRMLIAVTNTGQLALTDFAVAINGADVQVLNQVPEKLEKGESAILQTGYTGYGVVQITVVSGQATAEKLFQLG